MDCVKPENKKKIYRKNTLFAKASEKSPKAWLKKKPSGGNKMKVEVIQKKNPKKKRITELRGIHNNKMAWKVQYNVNFDERSFCSSIWSLVSIYISLFFYYFRFLWFFLFLFRLLENWNTYINPNTLNAIALLWRIRFRYISIEFFIVFVPFDRI